MEKHELFQFLKDHVTVELRVEEDEDSGATDAIVVELVGYDSPMQWHHERQVISAHRLPAHELASLLKGY